MQLADLLKYAALIERVVSMVTLAVDNNDGDENTTERFARRAGELVATLSTNMSAAVAFDEALADRVNALADEFEGRVGQQTPEGYRAKADELAELVERVNAKHAARVAAEAGV